MNASAVTGTIEPAPTIQVKMTALNGSSTMSVLPDSGVDISVAGLAMLHSLNEHPDNLEPSSVTPRAINGTTMSPIGKLQVCLSLWPTEYTDDFHIPANLAQLVPVPPRVAAVQQIPLPTSEDLMAEFPSVFDGKVKVEGG